MNLAYFANYVTIVEEGSLTAAARKLRIAQPALSNQIKALETTYGTRLFYRGARRLELTDAGRILYEKAKWMMAIETEARNEITSGFGGSVILETAKMGLEALDPALAEQIDIFMPDEKARRLGQSVAAAQIPSLS